MKLISILKRPIITEKSMAQAANGRYTFEVAKNASKGQIKKAVEDTFDVSVVSVNTMKIKGKKIRTGRMRRETEKKPSKKAIVELVSGQKIDLFETQT